MSLSALEKEEDRLFELATKPENDYKVQQEWMTCMHWLQQRQREFSKFLSGPKKYRD